ncbi:MAG: CBS domain-containing protein [Planctomycetota bacterium]|nr:CBS domain-containing protein [Planctomycetota bacterium]
MARIETYEPTRVGRWMSGEVVTIDPEVSVHEALEVMSDHRIRHLPVVDDKGGLVGILSNRDAVRCAVQTSPRKGWEPARHVKVREVMTTGDLHCVTPSALVLDAAETICREKVSALPVVQGKKLIGIVSSEDLLWALLDEVGRREGEEEV